MENGKKLRWNVIKLRLVWVGLERENEKNYENRRKIFLQNLQSAKNVMQKFDWVTHNDHLSLVFCVKKSLRNSFYEHKNVEISFSATSDCTACLKRKTVKNYRVGMKWVQNLTILLFFIPDYLFTNRVLTTLLNYAYVFKKIHKTFSCMKWNAVFSRIFVSYIFS